jgi:hypothetical protein
MQILLATRCEAHAPRAILRAVQEVRSHMKHPRLLLAAFGLVGAVAAGALFAPTTVCATTGGCLIPTFAVSQYLSTIGNNILFDLASNEKICKEQCDELANGCVGVANAASKCALRSVSSEAQADAAGCKDDQPAVQGGGGSGQGECKRGVRSGFQSFQDFIASDQSSAQDDCEAARQNCISSCED